MRTLSILCALSAVSVWAQTSIQHGSGAPSASACNESREYGRVYMDTGVNPQVMYTCGLAGWTALPASTGANTALSNLASVSINTSLLAQTGVDAGSPAKAFRKVIFYGSGTYGTTSITLDGTPTGNRVWTFADATDTVVGLAATQTLTNKTLTSPKITTILDAAGNPFLLSSATASAVDSVTVTNAATANPATVTIGATGSDSNINLSLVGKGTGGVQFPNGASTGSSPPSVTAGTGGVQAFAEGTVPTVCAASAVDCLYANSTQHGFLASFNNGSFLPLVQGPASQTTGRVASWNGTNGGLLADAGFLAADVVRAVAPGAGICHFAGSTQVCTSSLIVNADITNTTIDLTTKVTGILPTANIAVALANQTSLRGNAMAAAAGDATIGQVIAHGAKALDFASTATGACATVITDTATGAASTDVIIFNANASIKAVTGYVPASTGGFSISAFPSTNTVSFEACNWTAGTVDPGSITVNWVVIR